VVDADGGPEAPLVVDDDARADLVCLDARDKQYLDETVAGG